MRKYILQTGCLLLLLVIPGKLFSQDSKIHLGLKISPAISWMNPNEKNYSSKGAAAGIGFGFISDFYFTEHYAFSTGFNFSFLSGNLQFPYASSPDTGVMKRKYSFRYLEIPLMIKMKTKEFGAFSFFGQIGFGTGFNLRTKANDEFMTDENKSLTDKYNLSSGETTLIREAILVALGTEYKIDESVSLLLSLGYSNSLNNVLHGSNSKDPGLENRSSLNYVELNIGVLF
ncbi:MAG: porin family protein [Bacteroidetes bacterium]|nr:porin family protein [Bacteroidota bacterium]